MYYYINNFLLFSIIGFFFETILFAILKIHNQSGFMHLWWTPFYGTGVIIVLLSKKWFDKLNIKKKYKTLLMILYFFVVLSLLEFSGGWILERLHGYSLWTYEIIPLHIGKYISIGTSLIWTMFAFLYLYVIRKYTDKFISHIPKFITIIASIIFIIDFLYTIINLLIIQAM